MSALSRAEVLIDPHGARVRPALLIMQEGETFQRSAAARGIFREGTYSLRPRKVSRTDRGVTSSLRMAISLCPT
jgi:hypothetical protein